MNLSLWFTNIKVKTQLYRMILQIFILRIRCASFFWFSISSPTTWHGSKWKSQCKGRSIFSCVVVCVYPDSKKTGLHNTPLFPSYPRCYVYVDRLYRIAPIFYFPSQKSLVELEEDRKKKKKCRDTCFSFRRYNWQLALRLLRAMFRLLSRKETGAGKKYKQGKSISMKEAGRKGRRLSWKVIGNIVVTIDACVYIMDVWTWKTDELVCPKDGCVLK